jgi:hypothetical protein
LLSCQSVCQPELARREREGLDTFLCERGKPIRISERGAKELGVWSLP